MSMPSNKMLRFFSMISGILSAPPEMSRSAPSGSKGVSWKRQGRNHAHRRKGYNKIKK